MTEPTTPAGWGIQMSKLWIASGQAFPVDVKLLALEVTKQRFADPVGVVQPHGVSGLDGMLHRRRRGDWCISFDDKVVVPGRVNFTLAHELGHYFCHRQRQLEFRCSQAAMLDYYGEAERKLEKEANTFASYLLMPATDFRQQTDGRAITLELLGEIANRYQTSFTATTLRWLELTQEAAMLVVARDEFVCWSYPSKLARRAWMAPGTPVPDSSIERLSLSGSNSDNPWCRVPAGVWHPSLEADEAIIISDQFDLMIFLVRFPDARVIVHDEEVETDAFDVMTDPSRGFNWSR